VRLVADGVYQLRGTPRDAVNAYLVEDVLIDAGTSSAKRRILRQLRGRDVRAHALTHAHPDHFGSSHAVCKALDIPLWCSSREVGIVETGELAHAQSAFEPLLRRMPAPEPHPVARRLEEDDEVAGFRVLDAPGHSPAHIAYWRESDRTLICGDVFFNLPRLREPLRPLTIDPERNRESMRRLARLEPELVLFGHGPPLRDTARFVAFGSSV
jgi:hydroxyacylglutathione hydrolase